MKHFFSLIIIWLSLCLTNAYADTEPMKLRVALLKDFPPYSYKENGVVKGFVVDYMKGFQKFTGLRFEYVIFDDWASIHKNAQNDVFDVIPNQGYTPERDKVYHFSNPYETFHISVFIRTTYQGEDNIDYYRDKKAGVMERNVGVKVAKREGIDDVVVYKDVKSLLFGLLSSEVDCAIIPESVFDKEAINLNVDDKINIAVDNLLEVKRSFTISRPNQGLADYIFPLVDEFSKTEDFRSIYLKWFSDHDDNKLYKQRLYILVISFVVLTIFMFTAFIFIRVRDAKRHTNNLQVKVDELTSTKKKLDNLNQNLENMVKDKTEEITETKERYELVVDASNTGVWDWDIEHDCVYFSSMWKQILGYEEDEIKNDFDEFIIRLHPDDKEYMLSEIDSFVKNPKGNFNKIFRMRAKDGSYKWIMNRSSFVTGEDGNIKRMFGSHLDITELKNYEEKLALTNKTLTTILNAFPEVLYVSDTETYEIIFANERFIDLIGANPIGELCYKTIQGLEEPCSFCTNEIILNNEGPYVWEHYNKSLDTHFYVNDQIIEWVDGKKVRFEIAININYLKDIENKLKESNKEFEDLNLNLDSLVKSRTKSLEEVNKELESFAYTVSHDLRAPVRHINGFINMLDKDLGDIKSEKTDHCIDAIKTSSERMNMLIDDLLKFSRLNQVALQKDHVNLKEVAEQIINDFAIDYVGRDIDFRLDIKNDIYVDKGMFAVVFTNLISNAIKFTQVREKAVVEVNVYSKLGQDIIEFKDNGLGFDMKYVDRVFGVFETLDQDYSGTGIGLATVKRIITRHGGYIEAKSAPDEGALFKIYLPKAEDDDA